MSVKSVLKGCHEVLGESALVHWDRGDNMNARHCEVQAEAVLRLLADLDNAQQEETSDATQ